MNKPGGYLIELVGGPDDGHQLNIPQLFETWDMIQDGGGALLLEHDENAGRDRYYLTIKMSREGRTLYYHEDFFGDEAPV